MADARKLSVKRRNRIRLQVFQAAVILVPVMVLFWEILFAGRVLFWGTPLLQFVPWYQAVRDAIRNGLLPLWNPLVGAGAPLMANYQSAVFYPPNWLHLIIEPSRSMSLLMVAHVLWAGVGMWIYTRAIGYRSLARLVSALSFMLSGYLVSRLGFPSIGSTLPWAPWLLYMTERLLARPGARNSALLALVLALQLLAGHAQTVFYSGLVVSGYFIVRAWTRHQPRPRDRRSTLKVTGWFVLGGVLAFGLAAIQLVPTAELQVASQRAGGVESDLAMTYSLWPLRVISFFAPRFFGHPATGNYWGYCCNYWEDNGYIGVLAVVLALSAAVAWMRWRWSTNRHNAFLDHVPLSGTIVPFFCAAALLSLVLAFGVHTPIYPLVFRYIPVFGQFQAPARLLCIWTLAMSVLAGIGAELWRPTARTAGLARYGIITGLAFLVAAAASGAFLAGQTATFRLGIAQLGTSLVVMGVLTLIQPRPAEPNRLLYWSAAVLLFLAIDLVWANWGANPTARPWLYTRSTKTATELWKTGIDGSTFYPDADEYEVTFDRYLSFQSFAPASKDISPDLVTTEHWFNIREALLPDTGVLDHLASLNNFDPLRPARHEQLVETINAADGLDQIRLLEMAGVSVLIAVDERPAGLERIYSNSDVTFYRIPDPLPRAYIAYQAVAVSDPESAQIEISRPEFDPHHKVVVETDERLPATPLPTTSVALTITNRGARIRANLGTDGLLVFLDTYYPGWSATVDGNPVEILPANLAFKAVRVPAGDHLIEFSYQASSARNGATVTALTGVFVGLLALRGRHAHHHRKAAKGQRAGSPR